MKNTKPTDRLINQLKSSKNNSITTPNDGTFIGDDDLNDGFSSRGTVRYGEETDVDDI